MAAWSLCEMPDSNPGPLPPEVGWRNFVYKILTVCTPSPFCQLIGICAYFRFPTFFGREHWGSFHVQCGTLCTILHEMGTTGHFRLFRNLLFSLYQCCGSGMIYSGSGSSYELLEFRIRILPIKLSIFGNYKKLIINQNEESTVPTTGPYLPFSTSHYKVLQNYSPESSGIKIRNKIFIYLLFHFCWIRNK